MGLDNFMEDLVIAISHDVGYISGYYLFGWLIDLSNFCPTFLCEKDPKQLTHNIITNIIKITII